MNSSSHLPDSEFDWKQEASRRLAEYRRLTGQRRQEAGLSSSGEAGDRLQQQSVAVAEARDTQSEKTPQAVAARVAARYAQAPRYYQLPDSAAEAASYGVKSIVQAALRARAAARSGEVVVPSEEDRLTPAEETATENKTGAALRRSVATASEDEPATAEAYSFAADEILSIAPEPVPVITLLPEEQTSVHCGAWDEAEERPQYFEASDPVLSYHAGGEAWGSEAEREAELQAMESSLQTVEPALPIHANLIEFPRELVATRKVRPRLAEGLYTEDRESQLSIFEVEPGAISTEPVAATVAEQNQPEWFSLQLEGDPVAEPEVASAGETAKTQLYPAQFKLRLTAAAIDGAIIAGVMLAAVAVAGSSTPHPLHGVLMVVAALAAFCAAGLAYHAIFLLLGESTPGMRSTGISLCTFDEEFPTPAQLRLRLYGLLLSVAPVGLGLLWAILDEDHLCWHDRLSRTYPRLN